MRTPEAGRAERIAAGRLPILLITFLVSVSGLMYAWQRRDLAHLTDILFFVPVIAAAFYCSRRYVIWFTAVSATLFASAFVLAIGFEAVRQAPTTYIMELAIRVVLIAGTAFAAYSFVERQRTSRDKLQGVLFERDQHIAELQFYLKLSETLAENLSLEMRLDRLLHMCIKFMRATSGSIMLLEEDGDTLTIAAARDLDQRLVDNVKRRLGEGISGYVAQTGEPLLLLDGVEDHRFDGVRNVKDAMCVPLKTRDEVLGVISINDKRGAKTFAKRDLQLFSSIARQAAIYIQTARLFKQMEKANLSTIAALVQAIEAKDRYTRGHSVRVTELAVSVGREMGMAAAELKLLETSALLHDVGKIGVPEQILLKPSRLTDEEFEQVKQHPAIGAAILQPIESLTDAIDIIYHHHERFDGAGYLDGIGGEDIPMQSRVLAVCDTFEAMTADRPYRKAMSYDEAVAELRRVAGTQLDPMAVEALIRVIESEPVAQLEDSGVPATA